MKRFFIVMEVKRHCYYTHHGWSCRCTLPGSMGESENNIFPHEVEEQTHIFPLSKFWMQACESSKGRDECVHYRERG